MALKTRTASDKLTLFLARAGMKKTDFTSAQLTAMLRFGDYCVETYKKEASRYCTAQQELGDMHRCEQQCENCFNETLKSTQE